MPNEFAVVGEHRDDAMQLLVIGSDGRYYDYDPSRELIAPVDVDEHWRVFIDPDEALEQLAPSDD